MPQRYPKIIAQGVAAAFLAAQSIFPAEAYIPSDGRNTTSQQAQPLPQEPQLRKTINFNGPIVKDAKFCLFPQTEPSSAIGLAVAAIADTEFDMPFAVPLNGSKALILLRIHLRKDQVAYVSQEDGLLLVASPDQEKLQAVPLMNDDWEKKILPYAAVLPLFLEFRQGMVDACRFDQGRKKLAGALDFGPARRASHGLETASIYPSRRASRPAPLL